MNPHLVVVGSLNADFVINVDRFPQPGETLVGHRFSVFPGGKGANQAYAVAKLGGQVSMVGQVGHDAHADWLKQNLAAAGADVSHVHVDSTVSSGVATITINADGQNQIIIIPGANGTFTPEKFAAHKALLSTAGLVLLQLEIPLETVQAVARLAKEAGALVLLDPAPARPLPKALLGDIDYLTPNETELCILTNHPPQALTRERAATLAKQLHRETGAIVIAKLGAQGALLVAQRKEHFWPALQVKAVDSTAAGDAFNGAFAFALAAGKDEVQAGRFATGAAACSVMRAGAQPSMPTLLEVETLLSERAEPGS